MKKNYSLFSAGVNPRKVGLIRKYFNKGRALDIACGNGLYGLELERCCEEVLQLDILDRRDERAKGIKFQKMDVQNLDLPDNSFKNAIAYDIIEHLEDDILFCQQLRKVCSGHILISVPHSEDSKLRKIGVTHKHQIDKTHYREYSESSLRELMETTGFEIIEIMPQFNTGVESFPSIFARETLLSKLISKFMLFQIKFFIKIGILENDTIADLFVVVKRKG